VLEEKIVTILEKTKKAIQKFELIEEENTALKAKISSLELQLEAPSKNTEQQDKIDHVKSEVDSILKEVNLCINTLI